MRIVHLVHQYPPEFRGGTEVCVESLAAAQLERGDLPTIIAGSDQRDPGGGVVTDTQDGVSVHRVRRSPDENYSMDYRLPRVAEVVTDLVHAAAADVVHLHHTLNLSADLGAHLAAAGLPVVATLHDFTTVCARFFLARPDGESCAESFPLPSDRCIECVLPDFPAGREELSRQTEARRASAQGEAAAWRRAIVPSQAVADRWRRSGLLDEARLFVLPHPTRLAGRTATPARPRGDGRLVLVTWGHLAPAKGTLDLLAALSQVNDPRLSLIVLGEPTDLAHGAALITAASGLTVEFRGGYTDADLLRLPAEADLAVFPSRAEETFGLVVAEARALGLPVISSDRGALPESVGAGGTIVPAADPEALAELLKGLLADPSPLGLWSAATREDLMTPAAHADRVAEHYAAALP